ncbi:twitching motility protein PilT [Pasteurellaceae bacterium Macca]|nr:twitching motility protein PilT [Pasteurellaceae bacterium Macca]
MSPCVRQWLSTIKPSETFISCISIAEIKTGILLKARKDQIQAERINQWFQEKVLPLYRERTLSLSSEIALLAAEFHIPNKMDINDAYIAATAKHRQLTLVTRNTKDFIKLKMKMINPFED